MLVMLAAALLVLTAGVGIQARQALTVGTERRVAIWLAASLALLILTSFALWRLISRPELLWWTPPTGFGVEWQCQENVPPSVRVCFKR